MSKIMNASSSRANLSTMMFSHDLKSYSMTILIADGQSPKDYSR